jgi:peptidoglycan/xylan/chitin deacetylase (PgdA/CDA1 family)
MKAVMYHYVRLEDPTLPHFRYLHYENFCKQLDYFHQNYGFVTPSEWAEAIESGDASVAKNKVVLTFDDAMSCHYTHVFPELQKRGLWGMFYVPAQPYFTGKILNVHRVHLLCGKYDGNTLYNLARQIITDDMVPFEKRADFRESTYQNQSNSLGVSEFKRLMNYYCLEQFRTLALDKLYESLGAVEEVRDFYVSLPHLKEMKDAGNIIGSHTVSHPVMSKLSISEQELEISKSFGFLEDLSMSMPKTYCHPYGGFHSFNDDTIALLKLHKVAWSFNVEGRDITSLDLKNGLQHLPRYDCNKFPYGTAS